MKTEVPVFIFAGFLDSGKTTALQGTLLKTRRPGEGKAVIICTEEGEEEFKAEALSNIGISIVQVEDEEELTTEYLEDIYGRFEPECVYVEFNSMWNIKTFISDILPKGWFVANILSIVDASTYDLYLKNMRQTIMTPLSISDVILFNRCSDKFPKSDVRRALKILNARAEVYFARLDGSIDNTFDDLIFEGEDGGLKIDDEMFCPWFVDTVENSERYYGKTVSFTGMVTSGKGLKDGQFYIGRYAAICCPEDAQFIGFVAEYGGEIPEDGDFAEVKAVIVKGEISDNRRVIMLAVNELEKMERPEDIFVYF